MKQRKVRRLPVVDHDKLVGIVTLSDVLEASPSDATTLSVYEMNYGIITESDIFRMVMRMTEPQPA